MVQDAIAPRQVLVLYWTPLAPSKIRAAIRHHLEAIKQGPSAHRVTFWNAFDPGTQLLRKATYDAVILHTTLLCLRWFDTFPAWRRKLSWVGDLDGLKIAMPQDEYNHSEILDEWLRDLGVDHIFTNFGADVRPLLYPQMSNKAQFQGAFTGYIDVSTANRLEGRLSTPARRPFDVVYRATHPQFWFGSLGQMKYLVGKRAEAEADARGLKADISSRTDDAILGDDWFDFLAAGRVVVGSESGSSVLDRRGEMQASVRALLRDRPGATFEEISALMPKGWDSYRFAAISPRHFEAVITKTCQVLVEGRYDGVFVAGRHYLPVRSDLADLGDVLEHASDPVVAAEFAARAYDEIYRSGRYAYRVLAEQVDRVLETRPPKRSSGPARESVMARFGSWRLNRPAELDSGWTFAHPDSLENSATPAAPLMQMWRLLNSREGRRLTGGALRGRLSRRLLGAYLRSGSAGSAIPAAQLLAEARLLDRMSSAQQAQPQTPASRTIKAAGDGTTLLLSVLRKPPRGGRPDYPSWPPQSIVVRLPSFGGLAGDAAGEQRQAGSRLDAVSALAAIRPRPVYSAISQLLDSVGGARSRPRARSVRSRLGSLVVTTRMVLVRPTNLWLLSTAVGRAPLRDVADDLLKLELLRGVKHNTELATRAEPANDTLCLVTEPAGSPGDGIGVPARGQVRRIIWDHSAVSDHVLARVGFGRRVRVYLGAAGVHEFTAVEALNSTARAALLRRLES